MVYSLNPDNYHFYFSSFIPECFNFPYGVISFLTEELPLVILFRPSLLAVDSPPFPSSQNDLSHFHAWRIFSLDIEFWVYSSFLSAFQKCATSFWPPWFLMRNHHSNHCFPIGNVFHWLLLRSLFSFIMIVWVWISLTFLNLGLSFSPNLGSF